MSSLACEHCVNLVQDLSRLKLEAYDAEFNSSLAAAKTLGNSDEVLADSRCLSV
jgi:hypothetical protein